MTSTYYIKTTYSRNDIAVAPADQNSSGSIWSHPRFPPAELVARITHRPTETCAEIARLAGFREISEA